MPNNINIYFEEKYGEDINSLFDGLLDKLKEIDMALYEHLDSIENMQSKYIEEKFSDISDIKENIDDIREAIKNYKEINQQICTEYTDLDSIYNKGFNEIV